MAWWGWALLGWSASATAGGFALGARIGRADRRERAVPARLDEGTSSHAA
jgi:hypothetical protein